MKTLEEIFEELVFYCPSGCWIFIGADSGQGGRGANYPKMRDGNRVVYLHRYVCEQVHGPIPDGHQVDHRCAQWSSFPVANRRCINPDHLEPVPVVVNQNRKQCYGKSEYSVC
jgi:hypothetical protein